ncbi:hypothetical protein BOTCAL_0082g00080 [Botryotinia calthae]|uniref:Peptidyl-prolyl cis-trans isomerase n=1 Tax=Botryotinia calthae TaxID=38488 RepID=A0A4Y8D7U1_9HELO|nr:hypothetical protein BOTCAL_0082g00080 [Botryotinia calthae]
MSVTLHTSLGNIKIEVFCDSVPKTAENFLALCASNYYDASPFHRLIPTFMIQTGGPSPPTPPLSSSPQRRHLHLEHPLLRRNPTFSAPPRPRHRPETNGSQFFILFAPAPHLDGQNTVFEHVIGEESLRVLGDLEALEVDRKNRPKEKVLIEGVTVHANPLAG